MHAAPILSFLLLMTTMIVGCQQTVETPDATAFPPATRAPTPTPARSGDTPMPYSTRTPLATTGYTYQRADGNRLAAGAGPLPDVTPRVIPLDGVPSWVVAAPLASGSLWVAVLEDGQVQAFYLTAESVEPAVISPDHLPPESPPALALVGDALILLTAPDASPLTHPILIPGTQTIATIAGNGDLVVGDSRLPVNALPDARILADESGHLLLLTDPTTNYDHGVLGDAIEAKSFTLIGTSPTLRVDRVVPMPDSKVIEGIAPIWADMNGDGTREVIVTASDLASGAQILVYSALGDLIASGPAIGQGYRWRHTIAVAPFSPSGEIELVDVLTPHIGGVTEFFEMVGSYLVVTAQVRGYTSHVIHTRNLDMAAAGDFDGDGRIELLLPSQDRTSLGGIRRTTDGAEVAWTVPLDAILVTNLATVTLAGDEMQVGVGLSDGTLCIYAP